MIQDTSLSTEMYLSKYADGTCGGWGIYEAEGASSSSAIAVDHANLRECNLLWATSVPAESEWYGVELDGNNAGTLPQISHALLDSLSTCSCRRHPDPSFSGNYLESIQIPTS